MEYNDLKNYEEQEISLGEKYDFTIDRFPTLQKPISYIISSNNPNFWSQIPFSGTNIFQLYPESSEHFIDRYKIRIDEIPNLIQFVRETKKIQFAITTFPTNYYQFEYLHPILEEFYPPMLTIPKLFWDDDYYELQNQSIKEIQEAIKNNPLLKILSTSQGKLDFEEIVNEYSFLKYYGLTEISDNFLLFFSTPSLTIFSLDYLDTAYNMFIQPIIDPFKANPSFNIDTILKGKIIGINVAKYAPHPIFPEIGSFLTKKIIHYPDSAFACKKIISMYEDNDLYSVYSSLNDSVINYQTDKIIQNNSELNEVLDNIWSDANKIHSYTEIYQSGITITIGVIGLCVFGYPGLLTSLGIEGLDLIKSKYLNKFSELIAKKTSTPNLATIYDFQKK